jgi:hypothetical protein
MAPQHHEIPTHLNVEDKAFFGLAVRQVMVLTVGLAAGYGLWTGWPYLLPLLRGGIAAAGLLLAVLLALVRPHGRGLEEWLFVAVHYARTPRASVWRPREPARAPWEARGGTWAAVAPRLSWKEELR